LTGAQGGEPSRRSRKRTERGTNGRRRVPPTRRRDDAASPLGARGFQKASPTVREADPKAVARTASRLASDIGIRPLKDLVVSAFPEDHPLRTVILAEKDELPPSEFVAKMEVWLVLLNRRA